MNFATVTADILDYSGNYPIAGTHDRELRVDGIIENNFENMVSLKDIKVDMLVQADDRLPHIPRSKIDTVQFAVGFTSNRVLSIWHNDGSVNRWTDLPGVTFAADEWFRLTIEVNYNRGEYRVYINSIAVPDDSTWFALANQSKTYLTSVSFNGTESYVDDFVVEYALPSTSSLLIIR